MVETWVEYKRLILTELERLDRTLKALDQRLSEEGNRSSEVKATVQYLNASIEDLKRLVAIMQTGFDADIHKAIERSKEDFAPYKLLLNGFMGIIFTAVISGLIALLLKIGIFGK